MTHQLHNEGGDVGVFTSLWPYLEVGGYEDELELQVREVMSKGEGLTRAERTKGVARTMFCKDSQYAISYVSLALHWRVPVFRGLPAAGLLLPSLCGAGRVCGPWGSYCGCLRGKAQLMGVSLAAP